MMMLRSLALLLCLYSLSAAAAVTPLATFTVKDYMGHRWSDEVVHFTFDVPAAKALSLTDAAGVQAPCQFTGVTREEGRVKGTVWTVLSLEPNASTTFQLRAGASTAAPGVSVKEVNGILILGNDRLALALPRWPGAPRVAGALPQPADLITLPAPLRSVQQPGGAWLCDGKWVNDGPALAVTNATTQIVEQGPVRITVEQKLTFTDGATYRMMIQLSCKQDTALITEDATLDAPKAAFRLSMQPGLQADRVLWYSNYWRENGKGFNPPQAVASDKENVVCKMRPWSFWWYPDITAWAGFYRNGSDPFVGVLALRPSRWGPDGWDGADRTEIPVTARPGGGLDLTFGLLAMTRKPQDGKSTLLPLHREWALTLGTVKEHVTAEMPTVKLRRQLVKYSEFPLDEVREYRFDFTPSGIGKTHPFLIMSRDDIDRVRIMYKDIPSYKAQADAAIKYIVNCWSEQILDKEGWQAYYTKAYIGNYHAEKLPQAYIVSDNPLYGRLMAAAVKGMTQEVYNSFFETPMHPDIGRNGPWVSETPMRLLLNYDLIAGTGALTPEEELHVRNALVFSSHFLAHPDYWNTDRGLCSANPNMTSSIKLPLGLLALYLDGHPKSKQWLTGAEDELKYELAHWVSPGGAWIENPGYQVASMDGMFLLAQALKNVTGRDYFNDTQFKATMDYYGFIMTPPDMQYPIKKNELFPPPMTEPAVGDMFPGYITPYNGWMAANTVRTDPTFSARQQFFWEMQDYYIGVSDYFGGNDSSGRAKGFTLALANPALPASPPTELAKLFPGFGSIMRTSWTDTKASYLCHRTGPNLHHYHQEPNSIIYYAKGAPLCLDFGNDNASVGKVGSLIAPWQHSMVSFDPYRAAFRFGPGSGAGRSVDLRGLPRTLDYSYGVSYGSGNQYDHRHILFVKSDNPLGANYVIMRDVTQDGQPNQSFSWSLWCVAQEPTINGNVAHFPGQFGVDLDVHVLAPAQPSLATDRIFLEKSWYYVWGPANMDQHNIHMAKAGSLEDFFTVLYPRAQGQDAAQVTTLAEGKAVRIGHMEGADLVLLSPGKPATATADDIQLAGEIAFARRYTDGALRLAVVKGEEAAAITPEWELHSAGPIALEIKGNAITGESSGEAHTATVALPKAWGTATVLLDGKPSAATRNGRLLAIALPAGYHTFTIAGKP